jgi:chromosome segregation ATPase
MNRRFSTSNCPTAEIAWTNFELRREIDKEVQINIENEAKIKHLEKQLSRYEDEIRYLNNLVEKFESRENESKKEISKLNLELRKSKSICEDKEKYILFQETHLLEFQESINKSKKLINIMAQSPRQRRIQPPNPGEHNDVYDIIVKGCRVIDDFIQGRNQNMTNANVISKLNIIVDTAQRFCDIAEWSERERARNPQNTQTINQLNNQVNQLNNQLQQNLQAFAQIQNDLNNVNNNFNLLNQAHIIQGQQLQNVQVNAQLWHLKYIKWKNKAKSLSSVIWFVNTPN